MDHNADLNSPLIHKHPEDTVNPGQTGDEKDNNFDIFANENGDSLGFYQNYSLKLKQEFNLEMKNDNEIMQLNLDILHKNHTINELTNKLKNKDKFIQNISKRLEDHHKRINNLAIHQNSLVDHSSAYDEKRISLQDLISRNQDLATKNFNNLLKINKKLKNGLDAVKTQKNEAIKELNILKEQNDRTTLTFNLKIKEVTKDHEKATKQLREAFEKQNETLEMENQKLLVEKANLIENLNELNKKLEESGNKLSELANERNEFTETNETLKVALKNLTNDLLDSNNFIEKLKDTCEDLENRNKLLETENENLSKNVQKLSNEVAQYHKKLEQETALRTKLVSTYEAKIAEYTKIEKKLVKASTSQSIAEFNYFSDSDESCAISLKMGELFNPQYFKQSNTKKRPFQPDGDDRGTECTQSKLPKKIRVVSSDGNDITSHSTF